MNPRTLLLAALALPVACRKTDPTPPPRPPPAPPAAPVDAPAATPAPTAQTPPPSAPPQTGRPTVLTVRVKNVGTTPIRILTNPDVNEMLHTWRLMIAEDRSDRSAMGLNDPAQMQRVKFFPVELPVCGSDAAAGFGGLGQTGAVTLAPGESRELGSWDGLQREEVNDPVRGVCLRELSPPPGRYRFHFDQPHDDRPSCTRVMFRWPLPPDAGAMPVMEIRCREASRDAGGAREEG